MSHQHFGQIQGRLPQATAPARPMHGLGGLGPQLSSSMMPTRGIGGAVGSQALASGLEELKRQADHWMQDQQATHQRNEVMSAKLKEQEKTSKTLQKEKEQLQVEVRDLKARIKEDCHAAQVYYDKLQLVESMQSTMLEQAARAEEQIRHMEAYRANMEKAINNQGRFCLDIEAKYDKLKRVHLATLRERDQALEATTRLEAELQDATNQLIDRGQELDKTLKEHDTYKAQAASTIKSLTMDFETAKTACANTASELHTAHANCAEVTQHMAKLQEDHATALTVLQEAHASALSEKQHKLEGLQQQLVGMQKRAEAAEGNFKAAKASNEEHTATISKLQEALKDVTAARDETSTKLSKITAHLKDREAQVTRLTMHAEDLQQQLSAATSAAEAQAAEAADAKAAIESQLKELQTAQAHARDAHQTLQQELQTLHEQHRSLQADAEAKQAVANELQGQLDAANSSTEQAAQAATKEIENLKEQLSKERVASRKSTESVAKRMDEMKVSMNKAKELSKEVETLKAQLDKQKADMDTAITAQREKHAAALEAQKALTVTTGNEAAAKLAAELAAAQEAAAKQLAKAHAESAKELATAVAEVQAAAAKEKGKLMATLQDAIGQLEQLKLENKEGTEKMDSVTQQLLDQEAAFKIMQATTADALAELQGRLDMQLKMTEHLEATVQEKDAETIELKQGLLELKAANKELQAQREETQAALAEKEIILGNIQSNLGMAAAAAQPPASKAAPKSTAASAGGRMGTRHSSARAAAATAAAKGYAEPDHGEEEYDAEQMMDQSDGERVQQHLIQQQCYSASQRVRHEHMQVEPEDDEQQQEEEQHYAIQQLQGDQQQDEEFDNVDDEEQQELDEPVQAPATKPRSVCVAALCSSATAAGKLALRKHAATTPAAGIKFRAGESAATAAGKQQQGGSHYAADRTSPEFDVLATKTPYHTQAEARSKKVSIGGTQTIPSAAVGLAKKRARVVEPGYYADITSSLAGTQGGDVEDDAGYGGQEDDDYTAPPAAKRNTAPAAAKTAADFGSNSRRTSAASLKPTAAKPTTSGAMRSTSRLTGTHQVSQQQQRKPAAPAKPTASGRTGGPGGHRGRLGGMSMSVSGMSMDRHHGGGEVTSGAQSRRLKQQQHGAAAGRTGRMAPPPPKFHQEDAAAAQEKAAAAEKQSAAFDIFGAAGMF